MTNEEDLQNMDSIPFDELRQEFQDQVNLLRKKLFNKVKVKTMNGEPLNGQMLNHLLESYMNAVNNGAVPNIQHAWTYICKNQCQNALNEACKQFEDNFGSQFNDLGPMSETDLLELFEEIKAQSLENFQEKCIGEIRDEY